MSNSLFNREHFPHGVPMRRRRIVPKSTGAAAPSTVDLTLEKRRFRRPPKFLEDTPELVRKVVLPIVNDLQRGKANNTYVVTLTASVTSTTLTAEMSTPASEAVLTPKSATAAAAVGLVWTECKLGSVVIHHDSAVATDRTFGVVIHG